MYRSPTILFILVFTLASCHKGGMKKDDGVQAGNENENTAISDEDKIIGVWLKHPLYATPDPADTLYFSKKNGAYTLNFDCSGSPAPGWPSRAEIPYKFENGKLSYLNYYDNNYGFFVASSFQWITPGKEFEIFLRHILLYMSATYNVRYTKIK